MIVRWIHTRLSLWIILFLQVLLLIVMFFYLQRHNFDETDQRFETKVSFLKSKDEKKINNISYLTSSDNVYLKYISTNDSYVNFNASLCFTNGTDTNSMQRLKNLKWNCDCTSGWHGKDCGQPEVVWRAFLAHRRPFTIKGPRKYHRRIIYIFEVNELTKTLTEIRVNELHTVVDMFILFEVAEQDYLKRNLNNEFLKQHHSKILYINSNRPKDIWSVTRNVINNIKNDDIVLISNSSDIPNKLALNFLKIYDKWPEPISFRLKWSVYGFFWTHPKKTLLKGGASTVLYLKKMLSNDIGALSDNKTITNSKGLIIGDLNHFGGWLCEFCVEESKQIIELLYRNVSNEPITINVEKIDSEYIEDLIENGIYLNGKTELVRTRHYQDPYYAPTYIMETSWKYDFLFINLHSKLDYY